MQRILEGFDPKSPYPNERTTDYKRYQNNYHVNLIDPTKTAPFFDGLLHHHNNYMTGKDNAEELIRENERNFIEGVSSNPDGPFKYLDKDVVNQVHNEVDERLRELEETGLSRQEILFDDPKRGVPLKDDPFF